MSTDAVFLEVALIVAFAAGILYWVFVTPKREKERLQKDLDVGELGRRAPPQSWDGDVDANQGR